MSYRQNSKRRGENQCPKQIEYANHYQTWKHFIITLQIILNRKEPIICSLECVVIKLLKIFLNERECCRKKQISLYEFGEVDVSDAPLFRLRSKCCFESSFEFLELNKVNETRHLHPTFLMPGINDTRHLSRVKMMENEFFGRFYSIIEKNVFFSGFKKSKYWRSPLEFDT